MRNAAVVVIAALVIVGLNCSDVLAGTRKQSSTSLMKSTAKATHCKEATTTARRGTRSDKAKLQDISATKQVDSSSPSLGKRSAPKPVKGNVRATTSSSRR